MEKCTVGRCLGLDSTEDGGVSVFVWGAGYDAPDGVGYLSWYERREEDLLEVLDAVDVLLYVGYVGGDEANPWAEPRNVDPRLGLSVSVHEEGSMTPFFEPAEEIVSESESSSTVVWNRFRGVGPGGSSEPGLTGADEEDWEHCAAWLLFKEKCDISASWGGCKPSPA